MRAAAMGCFGTRGARLLPRLAPDAACGQAYGGSRSSTGAAGGHSSVYAWSTMQTLAKLKPEAGIWMDRKPVPRPGYNDVLVKVNRTAICGTDMHIYHWDEWAQKTIPHGMTVGHEFAGTVVEVGGGVEGFKVGDRVSGEGHLVCGHCRNCRAGIRHLCKNTVGVGVNRQGAFAEFLCIPASNAFPLPPEVSDEVASLLDPFGNATHTTLSFDLVGEDVLITGAGPIGIMGAALAKHVGAQRVVITDVNEYRLDLARKMGVTRAVNVLHEDLREVAFQELGMQEGFDVGLEMSGNSRAFKDMLKLMNHGGKVALLGIPSSDTQIDWNDIIFKGLSIKGIYGREMFETWYKMVSVLKSGLNLQPLITHRFKVDRFEEAFEVMASGASGKVVLEWD
uniref:Enoyl reductase (ER) domain-containing protein n=1 Tax=Alexandrium monilatum TaxID=311494 RepID=A0A7S4RBI0_9DINO